jgi:diacylglycerol kinase family enzyme
MPSPTSIAVIVNSRAGAALGHPRIEAELGDLFRAAGCEAEIVALQDGQDPADAARQARARASIVAAAGGDGTVSGVAAGLLGSTAALGVLPLGTLNHFAKDLHIPLDLPTAVAAVAAGHVGQVDAGQVNDHIFVNNSSIGIYPCIVDARDALRSEGHAKWVAMAIATWRVLRRYRGVRVSIDVGGRRRTWRTPFVFIGNNEYEIDGLKMGERARLDEGRLFVYLAPRLRAYQLPLLLAKALVGRARQSGDFEIVQATELWIGTSNVRRQRVAFDGEVKEMKTPLHYRTRAKALRVVLPRA